MLIFVKWVVEKKSHVIYKCDYHIVWIPKYRFRILKGGVKEMIKRYIKYQEKEEKKSERFEF
ncbi:MAG: transposase [Moheibacter sp.]